MQIYINLTHVLHSAYALTIRCMVRSANAPACKHPNQIKSKILYYKKNTPQSTLLDSEIRWFQKHFRRTSVNFPCRSMPDRCIGCNRCMLQPMHALQPTHDASCNRCILQPMHITTDAYCNRCMLQPMHVATDSGCNQARTGPAGNREIPGGPVDPVGRLAGSQQNIMI